jgi:hypothetical protein
MGAGFRLFDIRMDQVVYLGFSLLIILVLAVGIVSLVSSRTKSGRASLTAALGLFIVSQMLGAISSIVAMMQNADPRKWIILLALASRFVYIGGVCFLIFGLRELVQRNDLLEILQEEEQNELENGRD